MRSERGFHRLVNFSDAVVAIAITLLVLPLVDAASSIGSMDVGHFLHHNEDKLLGFALSFVVIGNFWWGHHQTFEGVKRYNAALVWGMFIWDASIVFLPFPTELLGASTHTSTAIHAIYVGTMVVATMAGLLQQWAIIHWPDLQDEQSRGTATIDESLVLTLLMTAAFVLVIVAPRVGLWSLLLLLLRTPIVRAISRRRAHMNSSRQGGTLSGE